MAPMVLVEGWSRDEDREGERVLGSDDTDHSRTHKRAQTAPRRTPDPDPNLIAPSPASAITQLARDQAPIPMRTVLTLPSTRTTPIWTTCTENMGLVNEIQRCPRQRRRGRGRGTGGWTSGRRNERRGKKNQNTRRINGNGRRRGIQSGI